MTLYQKREVIALFICKPPKIKVLERKIGRKFDTTRNFIEVLNILYQNPEKTMQDVIGENNYVIVDSNSKLEEEFVEFEV